MDGEIPTLKIGLKFPYFSTCDRNTVETEHRKSLFDRDFYNKYNNCPLDCIK